MYELLIYLDKLDLRSGNKVIGTVILNIFYDNVKKYLGEI